MSEPSPQAEAFVCQRCSQCCQGRGGIFLAPEQVGPAAQLMGPEGGELGRPHLEHARGSWEESADAAGAWRRE